ncbi:MAG: phosphate transport system regulatory protein PhoU [Bacteroidetes bacterium SW_9_63_38]|nr:MAG: phosphate transport system regulatory protein PhoU [Bacteroidetes bacterium SW_9_63_38]
MSNRPSLDRELALLRGLIAEMANHVDAQFADAMNALLQGDAELSEQVRAGDDAVDALELRIDEQCERILALHAPVAVDLRMLIMAVKMNTDLERIGDHCSNLARNAPYFANAPGLLNRTHLPKMADMSRTMLREAEDAFLDDDRLKARKVIARDLQVNRLHDETFSTLTEMYEDDPDHAGAISHLLTVNKALERISDHAKNIAQGIVFMVEGRDIRHGRLDEAEDDAADASGSGEMSAREA